MSANKNHAWAEAQRILKEFDFSRLPIPVDRIAKRLGATIRFSPMDNEELSGMIFVKNGVPIIGINSLHHPNRQRFTIAHELGHLVMHRKEIESVVHIDTEFRTLMRDEESAKGKDIIEIEANNFASELLVPESALGEALGNQRIDVESDSLIADLAKKFKVSPLTMQLRISRFMA